MSTPLPPNQSADDSELVFSDASLHTEYDEVPYENHPFRRSHPDAQAVVGKLFGMNVAPLSTARVLELGCGNGNNLVPIAYSFPGSSCVGVDLSPQAISQGVEFVKQLRLPNVLMRQMSIADIQPSFGTFDYIVCHGIYSWVGADIRDKILQICNDNLAPNGIAYISYNCLPGWHFRGLARELMRFHAKPYKEPKLFVSQSRAILDFTAKHSSMSDPLYRALLEREVRTVSAIPDWHLFHDYLEENNAPCYVEEFVQRAEAHGLQYLGDSEVSKLVPQEFPVEVQQMLGRFSSDIVRLEQYMDFLRNRMFRRTLLVKKDVTLTREFEPRNVEHFLVACSMRKEVVPGQPNKFIHANGGALQTANAPITATVEYLTNIWPRAATLDQILEAVKSVFPTQASLEARKLALASGILKCFLAELIELRTEDPALAAQVETKPKASRLAQAQLAKSDVITNLLHEPILADEPLKSVIRHADGSNDLLELTKKVNAAVSQNAKVSAMSEQQVALQLHRLLKNGLLESSEAR